VPAVEGVRFVKKRKKKEEFEWEDGKISRCDRGRKTACGAALQRARKDSGSARWQGKKQADYQKKNEEKGLERAGLIV